MSWGGILLDIPPPGGIPGYLAWQASTWPRLATALAGLDAVRTRPVPLPDRDAVVQWNPGRRASSTAKVDAASVAKRPCFLCAANLPPQERGLAVGEQLVLLANPAPIGPGHLVLAHREHRRQRLSPVVDDAVALAASGVAGTLLYNGPTSGASAPDHLHLQAMASGFLPDEVHFARALAAGDAPGAPVGPGAWLTTDLRVTVVLAGPAARVATQVRAVLGVLEHLTGGEPALNALLTAHAGGVLALLYPRGAHRPACYHSGELLVSPGSVDMAGLVVTVREGDHAALDPTRLAGIYREVTLPPALHAPLAAALHEVLS